MPNEDTRTHFVEVVKEFEFAAAHYLPGHPGPCDKVHGHTYKLEVRIEGPVLDMAVQKRLSDAMVVDFTSIKEIVEEQVTGILDHTNLNDRFFYPTAENVCIWIADILVEHVTYTNESRPELSKLRLNAVRLWETPTSSVVVEL